MQIRLYAPDCPAQRSGRLSHPRLFGLVTPTISGSEIPGLLGLSSLRKNRGILDCNTMQLHFCGPGDYDLQKVLPPGSDSFALELAPSGHLVLPCCEFGAKKPATSDDFTLSLVTRSQPASSSKVVPPAPQYSPRLRPSLQLVPPPPGISLA